MPPRLATATITLRMSRNMLAPRRSRFTPDGRFWWDGYGWVATRAAGASPRSAFKDALFGSPGESRAKRFCAVLSLLLAIVLLVVLLTTVASDIRSSVSSPIVPAHSGAPTSSIVIP